MKLVSEERLKLFTQRQGVPAWGAQYVPAIWATPQEAPRISRPTQLHSAKVGRYLHLLSQPEVHVALLALHHPDVYDIHEQRLLSVAPAPHPLHGSPDGAGLVLPSMRGTVAVAEELGVLARHPKLHLTRDGVGRWVAFPYVGDLLLFLVDAEGPYGVNWTVKLSEDDFHRRGPRPLGRTRARAFDPEAETRHLIEARYYEDAEIRTVRTTYDQVDEILAANLRWALNWHERPCALSPEQRAFALNELREAIGVDIPAFDVVTRIARNLGTEPYEVQVALIQGIWNRDLRVDLYQSFMLDKPMHPMRVDPLIAHRAWFGRRP